MEYKWLLKAQKQYGFQEKGKATKTIKRSKEKPSDETPEMIRLHFARTEDAIIRQKERFANKKHIEQDEQDRLLRQHLVFPT